MLEAPGACKSHSDPGSPRLSVVRCGQEVSAPIRAPSLPRHNLDRRDGFQIRATEPSPFRHREAPHFAG